MILIHSKVFNNYLYKQISEARRCKGIYCSNLKLHKSSKRNFDSQRNLFRNDLQLHMVLSSFVSYL